MRHYTFLAGRPGGFMNWPSYYCKSTCRIREVTIVLFRKWFGREPNWHWHKDGFMAEARDERGNFMEVTQENPTPGWLRKGVR